jgi:hypothetical protein
MMGVGSTAYERNGDYAEGKGRAVIGWDKAVRRGAKILRASRTNSRKKSLRRARLRVVPDAD